MLLLLLPWEGEAIARSLFSSAWCLSVGLTEPLKSDPAEGGTWRSDVRAWLDFMALDLSRWESRLASTLLAWRAAKDLVTYFSDSLIVVAKDKTVGTSASWFISKVELPGTLMAVKRPPRKESMAEHDSSARLAISSFSRMDFRGTLPPCLWFPVRRLSSWEMDSDVGGIWECAK